MEYKIIIAGMNQRSKLNIDNNPIFSPAFRIATDEPNKWNMRYFTDPHNMQHGIIL